MIQKQYRYTDAQGFEAYIKNLSNIYGSTATAVMFHVFAESWCYKEAKQIRETVRAYFPHASLVGAASFGNICDGKATRGDIIVASMIFEKPDARMEVFNLPVDPATWEQSMQTLLDAVAARPWAKAVETMIMSDVETVTACCSAMDSLPEHIEVFGGKSRFDHDPKAPKFVITDEGEIRENAAVFVIYGGEDLHIRTGMSIGWKPLGRLMKATRYEGDILNELDGRPAYEWYYKYLHIKNDEGFFFNTLEFPFLFYRNGKSVIRIAHGCLEDGSMVLGATIPENDAVRIAFGDAREILQNAIDVSKTFEDFRPDGIVFYSCGCRRTYWGDGKCDLENLPFESLAPTCGYYTAGEILRVDGKVTEHNSTLVIVAFREGEASEKPLVHVNPEAARMEAQTDDLATRFSCFIAAAIDELEEANRRLEQLSITDGLTGLYNRREIERRIQEACLEDRVSGQGSIALIMADLDDFKKVNDVYGHQEGDHVLQVFARTMRTVIGDSVDRSAGRWGGEEFIALVKHTSKEEVCVLAQTLREQFAAQPFEVSGMHTISVGVTPIRIGETAEEILHRVDTAMYEAKHQGKNQVVVL